jgi:hypothetical protein
MPELIRSEDAGVIEARLHVLEQKLFAHRHVGYATN